jgi:hypothetical protein
MKLRVLYDQNGEIVAAARRDGDSAVRAQPMPDDKAGHRVAEVYVPAEYAHYDLAGVCRRMRIESTGPYPEIRAK